MTAKYLTIRSTSLCAFWRYNQYLGVPVASAAVIPRAWIPWMLFQIFVRGHRTDSRKS